MSSKSMTAALFGTMMALGGEFSYLGNSTCHQCKDKGLDKDTDGNSACDNCPFSETGFMKAWEEENEF